MKINIIGVGGAGSNIVRNFTASHEHNEDLNSEIKPMYIDTSKNNHKTEDDFFHIRSSDITGEGLSGNGGQKGRNLTHVKAGIKEFINLKAFHKDTTTLNIVVFSLSGATGSDGGPQLINHLLANKCPVLGVCVGDVSDFNYSESTRKTLVTLNSAAAKNSCVVPMIVVDNALSKESISSINDQLSDAIALVSVFTSGKNKDLDDEDMKMFFRPEYKDITTPAGIYEVRYAIGKCDSEEKAIILRSICRDESEKLELITSLQSKVGYNDELEEPIYLLLTNTFGKYFETVTKTKESFDTNVGTIEIPVEDDDEFL